MPAPRQHLPSCLSPLATPLHTPCHLLPNIAIPCRNPSPALARPPASPGHPLGQTPVPTLANNRFAELQPCSRRLPTWLHTHGADSEIIYTVTVGRSYARAMEKCQSAIQHVGFRREHPRPAVLGFLRGRGGRAIAHVSHLPLPGVNSARGSLKGAHGRHRRESACAHAQAAARICKGDLGCDVLGEIGPFGIVPLGNRGRRDEGRHGRRAPVRPRLAPPSLSLASPRTHSRQLATRSSSPRTLNIKG
jgi:hypothetical protein